ncbi:DUF6630 family protein [Aliikangiella coralliicola]|uniref:DUF6630 domain-containing protein n=1 Tax=Aliikangiella coralliicola TaxID=2592383 RepID=A0A545U8K9_9GAMM|nr:hypothetical protein [Aliikangiella coralliicola]TQV85810.1 hypothetical protein FLL46_17955 [Aliikangiella coralliicola]
MLWGDKCINKVLSGQNSVMKQGAVLRSYFKELLFDKRVYIDNVQEKYEKIKSFSAIRSNRLLVKCKNPGIHSVKFLQSSETIELQVPGFILRFLYRVNHFVLKVYKRDSTLNGSSYQGSKYQYVRCDRATFFLARDYLAEVIDIAFAPKPTRLMRTYRNRLESLITIFDESAQINNLQRMIYQPAKQLDFSANDQRELEQMYWDKVIDCLEGECYFSAIDWQDHPDVVIGQLKRLGARHNKDIRLKASPQMKKDSDALLLELSLQIATLELRIVAFCLGDTTLVMIANSHEYSRARQRRFELRSFGMEIY